VDMELLKAGEHYVQRTVYEYMLETTMADPLPLT
jgi:hypothetical protein